jgi:uncharacterized protein YmfQ (DUF2313 family)
MMENLPPYYEYDPTTRGFLDVVGKELQRIEDTAEGIAHQMAPLNADDTYGVLGLWEALLGLPPNPPDATVEERRNQVAANIRKRNSGSATDWVELVRTALGTSDFTWDEGPGRYHVTITYPYFDTGYTPTQVRNLVRDITPAHLKISPIFGEGFIVGVSEIGVQPL